MSDDLMAGEFQAAGGGAGGYGDAAAGPALVKAAATKEGIPTPVAGLDLVAIASTALSASAPRKAGGFGGGVLRPGFGTDSDSAEGGGGPSPLTGALIYALIVMSFLAPLPLGSNRPVAWAFWAGAIGLMLALHLALVRGRPLTLILGGAISGERGAAAGRFGHLGLAVALALVPPIWGLVQMLPGLGSALAGVLGWPAGIDPALLAALAGDTISLSPGATGLAVMRMTAHVALFVLVLRLTSRASRAELLLQGLFYGITLHAVWAMVNLVLLGDAAIWGEKWTYQGVATGSFVNRNSFASFLGMGLVLGVVLLMDRDHRPRMRTPQRRAIFAPDNLARLAIGLCTLLILIAILATRSRAGLAGSLIGAGVAAAVMSRAASHHARLMAAPQRRLARRIWLGLAAAGLLALTVQGIGLGVIERGIFTAADWGGRGDLYANAVARIAERPWTGYGLDTFAIAYELGRSADSFSGFIQVDAHSTYLENWVDGGVIFGSALLLAGLVYLRHLLGLIGAGLRGGMAVGSATGLVAGDPGSAIPLASARPASLGAAALGVAVLAALHSLVDFSFEIEANVIVLVIILAVGVAPLRRKTRAD